MRKHIITILIVLFAAYAFINNKNKLSIKTSITESPTYKFVEEAKSYIEVLSKDPSTTSLKGKSDPILQGQQPTESAKKAKTSPSKYKKEEDKVADVNNKLSNIIYNVMHTAKGQELLEKVLLNPPIYDENKKDKTPPNPYHNNSVIDVIYGDGEPAECGDTVKAHYIIRLVSGQEIENTYKLEKPAEFRIGEQQVIKGLEYAVIGMKKDGHRRLVVPPKMAYSNKFSKALIAGNEFVTIDVELLEIKPLMKNWQDKIRIFENEDLRSRPILCSDSVSFNYTISTGNEKTLYKSTSPAKFILGNSSVPPAINKAFTNIRRQSKRNVIIPSSLLYNQKISFLPKEVKLPAKEMIILDIEVKN